MLCAAIIDNFEKTPLNMPGLKNTALSIARFFSQGVVANLKNENTDSNFIDNDFWTDTSPKD